MNRFSVVTASFTFLLIVMGALVTNNGAGDSVPTWPLAFGSFVPLGRLSGGVLYEYSHRVVASAVALLTVVLFVWLVIRERRGWVKWVGALAIALVAAQALLGGLRVSAGEQRGVTIAVVHALTAQLFFGVVVSLTVFTSPGWVRAGELRSGYPRMKNPLVQYVSTVAMVVLVVQVLLGAAYRHGLTGLMPHAAWGVVVIAAVVWSSLLVIHLGHDRERSLPYIVRPARVAAWLLLIQVALGIASYVIWSRFANTQHPPEKAIIIAVAHTAFGAALLSNQVILMLRVYRMVPITEIQA